MKKSFILGTIFLSMVTFLISPNLTFAENKGVTMKSVIVYYSYTGNTEMVAKTLAENIKADTIKIEDVERPSKAKAYSAGAIAARQGKSWPIKPFNKDLSQYGRIFVGCPVWFGMPAPEINAFVEQTDFKGKDVVIFVTMGGSGENTAIKALNSKITAKGGKIVSYFAVKTGMTNSEDIKSKTREIAKQY